jgi:hypothetical protein
MAKRARLHTNRHNACTMRPKWRKGNGVVEPTLEVQYDKQGNPTLFALTSRPKFIGGKNSGLSEFRTDEFLESKGRMSIRQVLREIDLKDPEPELPPWIMK